MALTGPRTSITSGLVPSTLRAGPWAVSPPRTTIQYGPWNGKQRISSVLCVAGICTVGQSNTPPVVCKRAQEMTPPFQRRVDRTRRVGLLGSASVSKIETERMMRRFEGLAPGERLYQRLAFHVLNWRSHGWSDLSCVQARSQSERDSRNSLINSDWMLTLQPGAVATDSVQWTGRAG